MNTNSSSLMGLGSMYPRSHITQNMSSFSPQGAALRAELEKLQSQNAPPGQINDLINQSVGMIPIAELLALKQEQQAKSKAPPSGIETAPKTSPSVAEDLRGSPQPMTGLDDPSGAVQQHVQQQQQDQQNQGMPSLVAKHQRKQSAPLSRMPSQIEQYEGQGIPLDEIAKIYGKTAHARQGGLADLEAHNIGHTDRYATGGIVAFAGGAEVQSDLAYTPEEAEALAAATTPKEAEAIAKAETPEAAAAIKRNIFSRLNPNITVSGLKGLARGVGKVARKVALPLTVYDAASSAGKVQDISTPNLYKYQEDKPVNAPTGSTFITDPEFWHEYGARLKATAQEMIPGHLFGDPVKDTKAAADTAAATAASGANSSPNANEPHVLADWQKLIGYDPSRGGVASLYANAPVYQTSKRMQDYMDKLIAKNEKGLPSLSDMTRDEAAVAKELGIGKAADQSLADAKALKEEMAQYKPYLLDQVPNRARYIAMGEQASKIGGQPGYAGNGLGGFLASYIAGEGGYDKAKSQAISNYAATQEKMNELTNVAMKAKETGDEKILEQANIGLRNLVTEQRADTRAIAELFAAEERAKGQSMTERGRLAMQGLAMDKDPAVAQQRRLTALGEYIQLHPDDPKIEDYKKTYEALREVQQGDVLGSAKAAGLRNQFMGRVMADLDKASELGGSLSMMATQIMKANPKLTEGQALQMAQDRFMDTRMAYYIRMMDPKSSSGASTGGMGLPSMSAIDAEIKRRGR